MIQKHLDFIADLTVHIPPKRKHLVRYYGIYASRTKGKSKQDGRFEKFGIKKVDYEREKGSTQTDNDDYNEVPDKASKQAWARLIQKVYEIDPLICSYCGIEMKIIAVIQDKEVIEKIIACMEKNNKAPPVVENA